MRKLILLFTIITITAGVYAQTDSTSRKMNQPDINNANDGLNQNRDMNNNQIQNLQKPVDKSYTDGIIMQSGKIMKVKEGEMTILENDMTLSNGTIIMSDGTFIQKDGKKISLKEGQHIDMSGNMTPGITDKNKNMDLVPVSTRIKIFNI